MALDEGTDSYRWFRLGFSYSAAGVYSFKGCLRPTGHGGCHGRLWRTSD